MLKVSKSPEKIISQQFSDLFNSYAKAYNKSYGGMGSLFVSNFKKKLVDNDSYLRAVFLYIHRNPVHHGFCRKIDDWNHSSYHDYLSDDETEIDREFGLDLFGGREAFMVAHRRNIGLKDNLELE